jgi:hypothetical protein
MGVFPKLYMTARRFPPPLVCRQHATTMFFPHFVGDACP